MTYPVYIGDRAAGTMTVTAAGQDTVFELRCQDPEPGLWWAWVQGEEGRLDLGLLEGGRLRRRFSRRLTASLGGVRWAGAEPCGSREPAWRPAGPGDCPLPMPPGAMCRREGRQLRLALPYGEDRPFPLTELFCLARIRAMDGGLWAEYRFEDGHPVPPEEN